MPAKTQLPKAAEELRREFGVVGETLKLLVDDVIVPVALVADLSDRTDAAADRVAMMGGDYTAAGVGQFAMDGLFNPPASRIVTVISDLWCGCSSTSVNNLLSLRPHNAALGSNNIDARRINPLVNVGYGGLTQRRISGVEVAITSSGVIAYFIAMQTMVHHFDLRGMELEEGQGLYLWNEIAERDVFAVWKWTERRLP
ncbi:MAG: hypothetical protein ACYTBJ_23455 [Planctomycetota bacterium]|jgi:hypothetical protein